MARDTVRFLLGREVRELRDVDPTQTVLEYLRRDAYRVGTKEGCAEGDCGACTVVLARLEGAAIRYTAVNACIQFTATLDGAWLLTVEDLKGPDGTLHPIQRAMVDAHASQCGFCTPGFVMSLFAMEKSGVEPTAQAIDDTLAGNLCRCTGYGPIITAARAMHDTPGATAHLDELEGWATEQLALLRDDATLTTGRDGRTFHAPATLAALSQILVDNPAATILAGSTDVGLWVTKQHRRLDPVVWLGRVDELRHVDDAGDHISIGAGVTYSEAAGIVGDLYPDAGELIRRIASVQIRNAGTIGGNIANGSPIGDMPPALIAAGATLVLRQGETTRQMPLEDFFLAYGRQDRQPGEFVERVLLPKPPAGLTYRCYKISKRFDQDISAVCAALALAIEGGRVTTARIAYGGMAATPKRAVETERSLVGKAWRQDVVETAMTALGRDFTPLTDMRASAAYRLQVARNLLLKCYLETSGDAVPLRLAGAGSFAHA